MKIISLHIHRYIDYVTVVVFLLAPVLIGLTGLPAILAYVLAGVHFLMTLVTDFPLGIVKLIPLSIHGWVERVLSPVLVLVSFVPVFTVETTARIFYIVMGIVIILVGLLTDYQGTQQARA
ncbi:MAG: hypothetical protein L0287_19090 [Anaerolineae bacterium]|nr:hypothetical protein [Anaerolineae bacterium]MCI0609420.1 hypothetical protein [Anaerolineae bacterium]